MQNSGSRPEKSRKLRTLKPMKPYAQYIFEGVIWKMHIDTATESLALEIRNEATWSTSFAWISLPEAKLLWKDLCLAENWWVGLISAYQGILLFHLFPQAERPEPKGLIALDSQSKEVIWQIDDYQLHSQYQNQILAQYREEENFGYHQIDLQTGSISTEPQQIFLQNLTLPPQQDFIYPQHYKEGTAYFDTVAEFLQKAIGVEALQAIDYMEVNNYVIINYFCQKDSEIQNNLLILDANVRILLHKKLISKTKGISLDAFFVYKNFLFFIVEKCQLEIYCF